jgi:alpha-L-rhamnosidase
MFLSTLTVIGSASFASNGLVPYMLRCEALVNPLAIESKSPQLSWSLKAESADGRNLRQTAYRIQVVSSRSGFSQSKYLLWDTGKVLSSDTFGIKYAGVSLKSRQDVWWRVQVWNQDGEASNWSEIASFKVGLDASDWKSKWIHGDAPAKEAGSLDKANWIWQSGQPKGNAKAGTVRFSKKITLGKAKSALIRLTADNTFVLRVNGKLAHRTTDVEGWKNIQKVDIGSFITEGENSIDVEATNATVGAAGLIAAIEVIGTDGAKQEFVTDSSWLAEGQPSELLGKNGVAPWGNVGASQFLKAPATIFQKPFTVKKSVKKAVAYVSALGIVDFSVNGNRVSEDLFTPGWTDYRIRTYYRAFDVTKHIKKSENSLHAVLGQGWYSGYVAWGAQRDHYGNAPMLMAQVEIEYADGSKETIGTDETWKMGHGPILDEHFLHGEKYDARVSEDLNLTPKVSKPSTTLEAFPGDPVRVYQKLKPKKIWKSPAGKYLIDFGQNLSGFVQVKLNQSSGTRVTMRHGERLDKDGELYTVNLRLAQAIDQYICKGTGTEQWNPRFTFHGFQYIEVTGIDHLPKVDEFTALAISSATPEVGTLETSDPMLNKLVSNAWWTQKMNFVDIPTDCPQRDERLGWTGDAQAYVRTATYFSDVQAFFNKWLVTLDDAQGADGNYPQVAPVLKGLDNGGPAWSDAGVICPMTIYDAYGDKALLARHYPQMKKFIEFCENRSTKEMLPPEKFHCFGDWLSIKADTPTDVIFQAYFAGSTQLVARAAKVLGKKEDVKRFEALHTRIKNSFVRAYVTSDGRVKGDTQCGYVLALGFDLLDEKTAKLAAGHLVQNIKDRNWHLSTGFVGTRDLMHVLSKIGRNDIAYRLLHNKTFPSWGFTIENGATSIWERWDGWTPENGFQDAGMNSFAHYAYGAVTGWMFKTIGGISELEPGYGKILIAPAIDPALKYAKTTYHSVRGPIHTSWKVSGSSVELEVQVPPNTTAEVRIPQQDGTFKSQTVGSGIWKFSGSYSSKFLG